MNPVTHSNDWSDTVCPLLHSDKSMGLINPFLAGFQGFFFLCAVVGDSIITSNHV